MKRLLPILILIALTSQVSALSYEEKPNVTAYVVGSDHLIRGTNVLNVIVYNPAKRVKVDYFDQKEAMFFSGREDMLFTAYNVNITLVGNDYITVKTSEQRIPALPPFKPVRLQFVVKVKDDAKAGRYELKLKVSYDIIDDLVDVETLPQSWTFYQKQVVDNDEANATYIYRYQPVTEYYKLRYKRVELEIPLTVFVDEKDVRLKILSVKSENMIGKGKGKITVEVKNVGEKIAKNAYLVLETPPEFKAVAPPETAMPQPAMQTTLTKIPQMSTLPTQTPTTQTAFQSAYFVGDLKPNGTAKATFYVNINAKDEGNYTFKIKAVYVDDYGRLRVSNEVPFGVHVRKAPQFKVVSVESRVYVNSKGDVVVRLVPDTNLSDVTVYLTASPPLSILSSEFYLGDVKAGKEYTAVFKVKASDEAKPVTYPAEIRVKYKSMDEYFESDPIEVGIKVNPKMRFEVYGIPKVHAGSTEVVTFVVKNVGNFTVREATARLTIVDPFSSNDDTAYIGTLKPGESAEVKFKVSVDRDATPKRYGLNLEVKYKDPEGEWAISEPTKAVIEVLPPQPPYTAIAIAIVVALLSVIYLRRRRK